MSSYGEVVAIDYLDRNAEKTTVQECKDLVKAKTHEWRVLSITERHDTIVLRDLATDVDLYTVKLTDGRASSYSRNLLI